MKILVIADVESRSLWDFWDKSKTDGIDLILSCGDLNAEYLSFLATMANVDVLYVHGNHDGSYLKKAPEGCICIDDKIINYNGIKIFGLGGSIRYGNGNFQYTEKEMKCRIRRRRLSLLKNRGFDILLTHSPARNLNDMEDYAHRGFKCFNTLIEKYQPEFFIHGHVHRNYGNFTRIQKVGETTVINAFEKYIIEI
ncbi:MAG: metallophosphoesterase family protein [Muribaculaceae bacterium]|nr:metallophosphoesterase family protein [Alistipes senegalensis]MCM1473587.1 metallophosphoesterase family protein [Muribaculaceae bacterium]